MSMIYGGKKFVAVGNNSAVIYSTDGVNWKPPPPLPVTVHNRFFVGMVRVAAR